MESIDYLIIGGGVAGTTAAETIRKHDSQGRIAIVSDEPYPFYSRILLSKPQFFTGKIPLDSIWLRKEEWYTENRIELISGKTASELDTKQKTVKLDDGSSLTYSKLLIAIGGHVRKIPIPGIDLKGVFYMRTLDDAQSVIAFLKDASRAVVVGGGFVGLESANILHEAGLSVIYMYIEDHFQEHCLGPAGSAIIERAIQDSGVNLIQGAQIDSFLGAEQFEGVALKDGTTIPADLVIMGTGIISPHDWIQDAGVSVQAGVLANTYLETNIPDIWVAGDCAEFPFPITGHTVKLGNWINSQVQGEIAGRNMTGSHVPYTKISSLSSHGFGVAIGSVGYTPLDGSLESVDRIYDKASSLIRFFVKDELLVGASSVNRLQETSTLVKLIDKRLSVSEIRDKLLDIDFDLKQLI